jgi:glutamate/tyrosine decarboxylase-like PLP-dependent enzyme
VTSTAACRSTTSCISHSCSTGITLDDDPEQTHPPLHTCRLVVIPADPKSFRLTGAMLRPYLTSSTAVVVASAVSYPHGAMDDVAGIAALCASRKICLHVDACLGGFVLPFMRQLGYTVQPFDFTVEGVTSMSVDTHKYAQAHKGTSVVLYRLPELRHAQYTPVTDWPGGLYISPGLPGSRCVRPDPSNHFFFLLSPQSPAVSVPLLPLAACVHLRRARWRA